MAGDYPQLGGKDHLFLLHADGKGEDRTVFPKHRTDAGRNPSQAHSELLSARAENRVARYSDPLSRQYHANIHKALKYAVKMDLIPFNPADKVERPKKQRYIADYYRQEELERLLEASKDHPYSLLIQMTAFYGLRRSEALGLKWDAIDFERDTITIKHIVTNAKIDGKCEIVCADRAKTKSSLRSLPLVSNIREKLLALREQQKENRRVCGNCYSKKYDGYVFVDAMGNIFNPRSVTANFSKLLEQNGLRHIRFHDLRHSCASLLLANDVPLKQIQEWLGHSDIGTTANIYSHLDYKSKITSANVMDNLLTLPDTRQTGWHT